MKTVAALGGKGGSGKSTTVVNLACEDVRAGRTATIIDLDPQSTSAKWSDRRKTFTPLVVSGQAQRLDRLMEQAASDMLYIDTQGRSTGDAVTVGKRADLILLPCRPTLADIETLADMVDLLRTANAVEKAHVFWNACLSGADPRIRAGTMMVEDMGLSVCPIVWCQRVPYGDALVTGHSVSEMDPSSKASKEVAALHAWVMEKV